MKSTFLNLHEAVLLLTVVEALLLCLALKTFSTRKSQSTNLLVIFFLLVAGTLATTLLVWNPYLQTTGLVESSLIPAVLSVCLLMEGPLLYAYLRSLGEPLVIWRWINLPHLLPAVLIALIILVMDVRIYDWLPWNWPNIPPHKHMTVKLVWAVVRCWPLIYVLACFHAEYRLRQQMQQVYSTISWWELRWADIILGGFFIHWVWSFVGYFIGPYISGEMNDLVGITNNYLTVLLVNGLFVFALLNGRKLLHLNVPGGSEVDLGEKEQEIQDLPAKLNQIDIAISQHKLYLDSQINLERFAEKVGIRPRELSVIINSHYEKNFFEFINHHRIEEAKRLLADPKSVNLTILDILFQSGFNSQSAFQRFFKRLVGVAPSEYRRRITDGK
jgi:AraC-like DNA-binding protein